MDSRNQRPGGPPTTLVLAAIVATTTSVGSRPSTASPLEDPSLGGAVFTGPIHGHASSMFVNPAALGLAPRGLHIHFGASGQLESLWVDRRLLQLSADDTPDNLLKTDIVDGPSKSLHTPSAGGILAWFDSFYEHKARLGVSVYSPTGYERFPTGGEALGYHSGGGYFFQGMLTLAGSIFLGNRVHLGLAISTSYLNMRLKYARDTALDGGAADIRSGCDGPCGFEHRDAREEYEFDLGSPSPLRFFRVEYIQASFGAVVRLVDDIWLSASFVTLPGSFGNAAIKGDANVTRSPRDGGGTETGLAELSLRMPAMVFVGYRMPAFWGLDFVSDVRWQTWSQQDRFDIRLFGGNLDKSVPEWQRRYRGMQDVWRLSAGLEQGTENRLRLGMRVRLESAAVAAGATSPLLVAGHHGTLALGGQYRMTEHWNLHLGYEVSWFPTVNRTSDSDYDPLLRINCVDSGYNFADCEAARQGRALSTALGRYRKLQQGLLVALHYDSL